MAAELYEVCEYEEVGRRGEAPPFGLRGAAPPFLSFSAICFHTQRELPVL